MKTEKVANNRVKFTFDVTPHEFEHGLDHAFDHVQKDVEVKGFRKGKVPRNIYETKFGVETLYEDALDHVLHHKYHEAQNHPDYTIVGQPDIDLDFKSIKRGENFEVSIIADVKPDVTLGQYKAIEVEKMATEVSDQEVEEALSALVKQNAQLEPKEGKVELGDTAIFDFEGFLDGTPFEGGKAENHELEIGSGQFIPGFEDQMLGMTPGEEKDLNVTFPKNYQAENLAGQPVIFKVKLHEVKTKNLSEMNDDFVKSLNKEGIETVDALRVSTRTDLEEKKENDAKNKTTDAIITKLLNAASVEIPQVMIDEEIKMAKQNVEQQAKQYGLEMDMFLQLSGVSKDQFEQQINEESVKRVRLSLVLETVAKAEAMKAEEAELEAKYDELAEHYKMPKEEIKKYIPAATLENDLLLGKAYHFVLDQAVKK